MSFLKSRIYPFLALFGVMVLIYSFCRLLFLSLNFNEFEVGETGSILHLFFIGLRFDISAIGLSNSIFAIFFLVPFAWNRSRFYRGILKYLFVIVNGLFTFVNLVDIAYFPFVHKRMQSDALHFLNGDKGTEMFGMIPSFALQYWYLWILFTFIIYVLFKVYDRFTNKIKSPILNFKTGVLHTIAYLISIGILLIGMRGGLQMRPLSVINATESASTQNVPIVLNSSFTMLRTLQKKALQEVNYVKPSELDDCDKGIHSFGNVKDDLQKLNVVIILVESLSKQYLSYFNGTGKTPFLDSLFGESYVFTNGFANGRESIQGIPAVLASIPSLQEEPFIFSRYSSNEINSIASLLKKEGYESSFFHGASTGTMGFHSFSKLAGFDHYYGLEDYGNKEDFDGSWGIWDEPFLQYMNQKLTQQNRPFIASILTLNSHHPFKLPEKYLSKFKQKGHPILSSIQYVDYALEQFFASAKKEAYYNNTLFVITADHTGPNTDVLKNILDEYRIPIVFYKPDGTLKGLSYKMANQIDIMPSILGQLEYKTPYFSQGIDLFSDSCADATVNYKMGVYQYIDSTFCYQFDGEKGIGFYNWKKDKFLQENLIKTNLNINDKTNCDYRLKKKVQVYNHSMLSNTMTINSKLIQ